MSAITGTSIFMSKSKKIKVLEERSISVTRTDNKVVVRVHAGTKSAAKEVAQEYLALQDVAFKKQQQVVSEYQPGGFYEVTLLLDETMAGTGNRAPRKRSTNSNSSTMATKKATTRTKKKATTVAKKKAPAKKAKVVLHKVNGKYPYANKPEREKWEEAGFKIPKRVSLAAGYVARGKKGNGTILSKEGKSNKRSRVASGALAGVNKTSLDKLKGKILHIYFNAHHYVIKAHEAERIKGGIVLHYYHHIDGTKNSFEADLDTQTVSLAKARELVDTGKTKFRDVKNKRTISLYLSDKDARGLSGVASTSRVRTRKTGAAKRNPDFKLTAAQKRNLSPEMQKGLVKYHKGK